MSDKVFFLRFKDHCATLSVCVTVALMALSGLQKDLIRRQRGGRRPAPIYLGSLPFKANK